jgi:anti-sigma regulatory factor (Ser/Thr protein kinase)
MEQTPDAGDAGDATRPLYCAGFAKRMHPALLRRAARYYLTHQKIEPDVIDSSVLVLSELLSNAIQHTRSLHSPWISVRVRVDAESVLIEVVDPSRRPPVRKRPTAGMQHGRGLIIVGELADWHYQRLLGGKRVTARVNRASPRDLAGSGDS